MIDPQTADVLNKAMDIAKNGIVAGYELIRQNAPLVWAMARRQTQLDGIELLIGSAFGFVATGLSAWLTKWCFKHDCDEVCVPFSILLTVAIFVETVITLVNGIDFAFNPDWWTLQKLMELVKK
jgi:hypothetical protein